MLQSLFDHLFRRTRPIASAPPVSARPRRSVRPLPLEVDPPVTKSPIVGARRPLMGRNGQLAGYEFHVGERIRQRLSLREDDMLTRIHAGALLAAMRLATQAGSMAYAEMPARWLPLLQADAAQNLQLCLCQFQDIDDPAGLVEAMAKWRQCGAQLGWRPDEAAPGDLAPDFLVTQGERLPPGLPWVAPDMPDIDSLELALHRGAAWGGCAVMPGREPRQAQALPPAAASLMQLLGRLVRDEDTQAVVADIKQDAALTVRLLQYLNSPGVSRGHVLESVEQAVAVLGRSALYHWASGMLVHMAPARPVAAGLQRMALSRARLLEMLGREAGEPALGSLFLLGLCSVLPQLMQVSQQDALDSLQLPESARQALLLGSGPWARYIDVLQALDAPDMVAAKILCEPMGGLEKVLALSTRSWLFG
jgi:EAL and modified HD-GYP domain-containing signal transduction protein